MFNPHNDSEIHKEATRAKAVFIGQTPDIHDTLSDQDEKTRLEGRHAMIFVFDTASTLARQRIPFVVTMLQMGCSTIFFLSLTAAEILI